MLVLDARHIELFSSEGYVNGIWQYDVLGRHPTNEDAFPAAGIFDHQHFGDDSTSGNFNELMGLISIKALPLLKEFKLINVYIQLSQYY